MRSIINFTSAVLAFILFLFLVQQSNAQSVTSSVLQLQEVGESVIIPLNNYNDIKGSPYYMEDFAEGVITFKNGKSSNPMQLRFNTLDDNFQFKDGKEIFSIDSEVVKEVTLSASNGDITFKKGFDSRRLNQDNFVLILADGPAKFIVKYSTDIRENSTNYGSTTSGSGGEFVTSETYYVKFGDRDTERVRSLNERRVMREFPTHRDEVETFANNNRIDFGDPNDVAKLFNYYNSLNGTSE